MEGDLNLVLVSKLVELILKEVNVIRFNEFEVPEVVGMVMMGMTVGMGNLSVFLAETTLLIGARAEEILEDDLLCWEDFMREAVSKFLFNVPEMLGGNVIQDRLANFNRVMIIRMYQLVVFMAKITEQVINSF